MSEVLPAAARPVAPWPGTAAGRWRESLLRLACIAAKTYLQHAPGRLGKQLLWDSVVRPYLLWRPLEIEARARFGDRFAGSFPDSVHSFLYFFGVWEPAVTAIYRAALRPGDIVVDVGANVGTHALLAACLVGPQGRVHAIEASPWIHARLLRNIMVNGHTQVITHNMAATEVPGEVTVFLHDGSNLGGTTIVPSEAERLGAREEASVPGLPLPLIIPLEDLLAARLIKIDVEGAEWLVVQGMLSVLPRLRADCEILIEVNPAALHHFGGSLEALLAIFAQAGFVPFEVANRYDGGFYIAPPAVPAQPFVMREFEVADLLFRRA